MSRFDETNTFIIATKEQPDNTTVALLYHPYKDPMAGRFGEFIIAHNFNKDTFSWAAGDYLYSIDTANHRWYEIEHGLRGTNTHVHTMLCGISCDDVDEWLDNHISEPITDEMRCEAYRHVQNGSGNWIAENYTESIDAALDHLA